MSNDVWVLFAVDGTFTAGRDGDVYTLYDPLAHVHFGPHDVVEIVKRQQALKPGEPPARIGPDAPAAERRVVTRVDRNLGVVTLEEPGRWPKG
jgi:hypothetical protein